MTFTTLIKFFFPEERRNFFPQCNQCVCRNLKIIGQLIPGLPGRWRRREVAAPPRRAPASLLLPGHRAGVHGCLRDGAPGLQVSQIDRKFTHLK